MNQNYDAVDSLFTVNMHFQLDSLITGFKGEAAAGYPDAVKDFDGRCDAAGGARILVKNLGGSYAFLRFSCKTKGDGTFEPAVWFWDARYGFSTSETPTLANTAELSNTKCPQTITFDSDTPVSLTYGDAPLTLVASGGGSGNPVTFGLGKGTVGVCSLFGEKGDTLTIKGVGNCDVIAMQDGNDSYNAAEPVFHTFTIAKKSITATVDDASRSVGEANPPFTITYSGLVFGDSDVDIDKSPSTFTDATIGSPKGNYPIKCDNSSSVDDNYIISNCIDGTLAVGLASPTLYLTVPNGYVMVNNPITLQFGVVGTGPTPTGTVTISDGTDSCFDTVDVGQCVLTPTTAGAKTLTANYSGDDNYGSASKTATLDVTAVIVTPSGVNVAEGGATSTYKVRLATNPASDVTVTLTPDAQVSVNPSTLTFTNANGTTDQTVTVTAVDDTTVEGAHTGTVGQAITTGDAAGYPTIMTIANVSATITDNDKSPVEPPPVITPPPVVTPPPVITPPPVVTPSPVVTPPPVVQPSPTIPKTMELHVSVNGDGQGQVTTSDGQIKCDNAGGTCQYQYDTGASVTLTATAAPGSTFHTWIGNDDCYDGQVTLYEMRHCTANFHKIEETPVPVVTPPTGTGSGTSTSPVNYTFTVNIEGQGNVVSLPTGIDCGNGCTAQFASGTYISLTAQAADGYVFTNYTGDAGCADGRFLLTGNQHCVAHFTVPTPPPGSTVNTGVAAFALSNYKFVEGARILDILVKRVGGQDGVLGVNYATVDGQIAKAGLDFINAQGMLTWNEGDTTDKTLTITLLDHSEHDESHNAEGLHEGEEVFYVMLTDTQGVKVSQTMVTLLHKPDAVAPPTGTGTTTPSTGTTAPVVVTPPVTAVPVIEESNCPPKEILSAYCDAQGQTVGNLNIVTHPEFKDYVGFLANAVITGTVKLNPGTWIANLDVKEGASVSGGTVTGWIKNAGTLCDFTFRGARIVGGTLCGDIRNISKVGGYFQDVQLAADTTITGGLLSGKITGDCADPARLENVRILKGSHLSCVVLGDGVVVEDGVSIEGTEETPELPALGKAKATDAKGKSIEVKSELTAGITALGGKDYQTQATVKVAVDPADVAGQIAVDPKHVGQVADLFVFATYQITADSEAIYLMRDGNGGIFLWNQNFANLVPFQAEVKLTNKQTVTLYKGVFLGKGLLKLYFGYRLKDGTTVQNGEPLTVTIE